MESKSAMLIRTSMLGVPVAVHTGGKGQPPEVGVLVLLVSWMSRGVALEFPGDDWGICFDVVTFCSVLSFSKMFISAFMSSLPTWPANDDVPGTASRSVSLRAERLLQYLL